ncbi:sulfurtransferase [Hymenobacter sp. GOD-10R]|uniref:sulfurtransferase n=1 Tax=Hymenobacter sp. GOD-10R TaxID=3093922 RepID=UPI002D791BA9|nr:sulfurtransferase [Hymenobacter sp. GOD-10R]WRQ28865.1 sulfurtransferase [Hymenobacter sp. GOD-10R]
MTNVADNQPGQASPIIKPEELLRLKGTPELVLIDVRTGPNVQARYAASHLEDALWVDLEEELAHKAATPADGGRHPLPSAQAFAELLGHLGISPTSHVVVYDDKNGANAAARFWWMLKALGHPAVQVLDGGLDAALAAGFPASSTAPQPAAGPIYPQSSWQLPFASVEEVEQAAQAPDQLVIDVRDAIRYRGEQEPIDLIAGHIPGAVNIPFTSNLDANGFFLAPEVLREKYTEALRNYQPEKVVVHCGSGVTACHTLLAMAYAGLPIPKLYVGSWSEWSNSGRAVATEV